MSCKGLARHGARFAEAGYLAESESGVSLAKSRLEFGAVSMLNLESGSLPDPCPTCPKSLTVKRIMCTHVHSRTCLYTSRHFMRRGRCASRKLFPSDSPRVHVEANLGFMPMMLTARECSSGFCYLGIIQGVCVDITTYYSGECSYCQAWAG